MTSILGALFQNAALLLAMMVVFDLLTSRPAAQEPWRRQVLTGLLLGGLGICLMAASFHLANGIIFDTRSVLLSLSGLFFGPLPTVFAMVVGVVYRFWHGGSGVWTGISVIVATGSVGMMWRQYRQERLREMSLRELYGFGLLVHLVMLLLMLTLPWAHAGQTLRAISLPVLLVYPLATVVLGRLLSGRLKREDALAALATSEHRYRSLFEAANVGKCIWQITGECYANQAFCDMVGCTPQEVREKTWQQLIAPEDVGDVQRHIAPLIEGVKESTRFEARYVRKDGGIAWADVSVVSSRDNPTGTRHLVGTFVDITERKQHEARIEHLNKVLKGIRNINQLIVTEDDPQHLIREACQNVASTMGYYNAWIALFGGQPATNLGLPSSGVLAAMAGSGLDNSFDLLREQFMRGDYPECARRALAANQVLVVDAPLTDCPNCPLHDTYSGCAGMVRRLEYDGVTYGIMTAAVSADYARDSEEQALFDELAGDMAFALHKIAMTRRLEQSRRHLDLVVEGSGVGTWEWNVQTDQTLLNERWASMLGFTIEELMPYDYTTWEKLVHPEDLNRAREAQVECVEGRTAQYSCDYRMKHKDGRWIWILDRGRVMAHDKDGRALSMYGTHTDITELKNTSDKLAVLGRMLDLAPVCISIHDREGRHVFANRETIVRHGYSSLAEFLQVNLFDHMAPASRPLYAQRIRQLAETGQIRYETLHCREDGTTFPLEVVARKIEWEGHPAILNIGVDISERVEAQASLRAIERRNQALLDHSPVCHKIVDLDFNLQYMSKNGFRMLKLDENAQVYGKPYPFAFFSDAFAKRMLETLEEVKTTGKILTAEGDATDAEGNRIWLYSTLVPVTDEDKSLAYITVVSADQTEKKHLEQELRQSQKLEAVGQLAGGVAHDFNNLLMGIMNYAELCRDGIEPAHPAREWLDEIMTESERSANLTRQLLAFARRQTIAPQVLDLNDAVEGMLKMLRRLIGEDLDLSWQPCAAVWPMKIDPGQIDQLLTNLCVNARDAIGGVGSITIETDNVELDAAYCAAHLGIAPGDYVMLAVSDTGCGMEQDTLEHVFEPFFTTKGIGEGSGLGLATVHGIIKQNKGHIHVYSEPGQGTTFRIYLPRLENADAPETGKREAPKPVGGSETILLVEDERSVRVTTALFLEQLGYAVLTADCPDEAISKAAEHTGRIHMLITDVIMPGMSGRDLAEKLTQEDARMKCLFISGYTANVIAHRGILDADVDFLAKPFTRDDIARKVREVLECVT